MGAGEVRLCGGLLVLDRAGRQVDLRPLGGERGRTLFAYLVVHRRSAVARDVLADVLWPAGLPTTWASALRTALSAVRQVGRAAGWGSEVLDTSLGLVRLVAEVDVDVERAESLVRDAEAALAVSRAEQFEIGQRADLLLRCRDGARSAAEVLVAPALPESDVDWAEQLRRRIGAVAVRAFDAWGSAAVALGRHDEAVEVAERAIRLDPLREGPYRTAMVAHRAAGRRADALRAFERIRSLLIDELGAFPSPETQSVYLELLDVPEWVERPGRRSDLPATLAAGGDAPFVGRGATMVQLREWWSDDGEAAVFAVLRGESGVGKSRVASELARRLHDEGAVVLHAVVDEGVGPIGVLGDLTRSVPGASELLEELSVAAAVVDDDHVGPLHDLADRVLDLAGAAPVLVLVDDAHWATRPLVVLLRRLLARSGGGRLKVLVTTRDVASWTSSWSAFLADVERRHGVTEVVISGLDVAAVAELISGSRGEVLPAVRELAEQLCRRTAGNALLVSLAVRHLREHQDLTSVDRAEEVFGPGRPGVPALVEAVRGAVLGRVASLGGDVLDVLRVAAVQGTSFELMLVADVLDGALDRAVRAADAAIGDGLVHSVADRPGTYRFVHVLVREALVASMSEPARLGLHHRTALALGSGRHPSDPFGLAWHLAESAPIGDVETAAVAAAEAAAAALGSFDHDGALTIVRRALALPIGERARAALLVLAGEAGLADGESADAHRCFVAAFGLASAVGDAPTAARAALGAMRGFRDRSEWMPEQAPRAIGEAALDLLGDDEPLLRVQLLGQIALRTTDPASRRVLATEAMDIGTGGDRRPEVVAATLLASRIALWPPERSVERLEHARAVERSAASVGDRGAVVAARFAQLADLVQLARLDEVRAVLAVFDEEGVVQRSSRDRWQRRLWDVVLAMIDGRVDDIATLAGVAFAEWGGETHVDALQAFGNQVAVQAAMTGRLGDLADQAAAWASGPSVAPGFTAVHAWAAAAAGHVDEACRAIEVITEVGPPQDNTMLVVVAALAEAVHLVGHRDAARSLVPSASRASGQLAFLPGPCVFFGPFDHAIGLLHAAAGDRSAAAEHLRRAVDLGARCSPFWRDRSAASLVALGGGAG